VVQLVDLGVLLTVLYSVDSISKAEPWVDSSFNGCDHLVISRLLVAIIESANWNENGAQMIFLKDEIMISDALLNVREELNLV
jgi:hypothetical protein